MISVQYKPWTLRGYSGEVWQVVIVITGSRSIKKLIKVKQLLNNPPVRGLILVENKSPAMKRLGPEWKEMEHGVWYKIFP